MAFHSREPRDARDSDVRSTPRPLIESSIACSIGRLIDLSTSGARISTPSPPTEEVVAIEIGDEHIRFCCAARVVWQRRAGFFRYEVGLFFPSLDEERLTAIRRLLETHRFTSEYGAAA